MAGESQKDPQTGQADPSVFTTEQLMRVVGSERDYQAARYDTIQERFRGIDEATKVLHETVTRTPTDIQQAVGHLRTLMDEKFASVATQFLERDTRQERESRDNKVAVDAAFAAQKEAAAKDGESNQKAIDKSERATNETIKTNSELSQSTTEALKERVQQLELDMRDVRSFKQGGVEAQTTQRDDRNTQRLDTGQLVAILSLIVAAVAVAFAVLR